MRTGMAELANPRRLTLAEAAAFVADRRQIEPDEARRILLRLLQSGAIVARGDAPLNAHRDAGWAWRYSAGQATRGDIPASAWFLPVDWTLGHVGRYRHITIAETDLTALFRAARGPGLRSSSTAVKKVVEDYAALENKDQRPLSQTRCWAHVKKHLSGATRAQTLAELRNLEPPKQRGTPRKENPPE